MGSSASKASRAAVGTASRKYPSRPSPSTQTPSFAQPTRQSPGPTTHPSPQASSSKSEAINLDASDPQYAANLRRIGVVNPNPFFAPPASDPHQAVPSYHSGSTISTNPRPSGSAGAEATSPPPPNFFPAADIGSNPALRILQSRQQLQDEAERELDQIGRRGFEGRKFVDIGSIRDAISLRDGGMATVDIEKRLGMKTGSVAKLGIRGVVKNVA